MTFKINMASRLSAIIATMCILVACTNQQGTTEVLSEDIIMLSTEEEISVDASDWSIYDNLIESSKSSNDSIERESLLHDAENIAIRSGALIPIYYKDDIYLQKQNISNIYSNIHGYKKFSFVHAEVNSLNVYVGDDIDALDPALVRNVADGTIAINSFSGLFTYDEHGNVTNDLANSYAVSEDGLSVEIELKSDLKWSDDSILDAYDFVYAWNRAYGDDELGVDNSKMFDVFAKDDGELLVTADEEGKKLSIKLNNPCPYLMDLLSHPVFFPVKRSEVESGSWTRKNNYVTNGAYVLASADRGKRYTFTKNPNYHRADEVMVENITYYISDDIDGMYEDYRDGELDFMELIPEDRIQSLYSSSELHTSSGLGTGLMVFNTESDVFKNMTALQANSIRRAAAHLIDRDYIVQSITRNGYTAANTIVAAGTSDGNGDRFKANDDNFRYSSGSSLGYYSIQSGNVDRAINALEDGGYELSGEKLSVLNPFSFEYLTIEGSTDEKIAESIKTDLAVIGIDMTIKSVRSSEYQELVEDGDYDAIGIEIDSRIDDPEKFLEKFISLSDENYARFGQVEIMKETSDDDD